MRMFIRLLAIFIIAASLLTSGFVYRHWQPDQPVVELAKRWAQPPSQFVDVGGMQVHLRDEGPRDAATTLVLLHGTASSLHTWDDWAEQLARSHRVIRFDLPGFGLTGPHPQHDYTLASYTDFVIQVLDFLGVQDVVLVGNSLGGNIAWRTAVDHPTRVIRLVLLDASGYTVAARSTPIGFRIASTPVLGRAMQFVLPRQFVRDSVENVFGDPTQVSDELVDRYFDMTTRAGNRAALVQRFRQLTPGLEVERIASIQQPTLILWGRQDRLIPVEVAERFAADIPNSRLLVFDALGHVPQEEDPAMTLAPVRAFLNQAIN